jgi:hypothetical protein
MRIELTRVAETEPPQTRLLNELNGLAKTRLELHSNTNGAFCVKFLNRTVGFQVVSGAQESHLLVLEKARSVDPWNYLNLAVRDGHVRLALAQSMDLNDLMIGTDQTKDDKRELPVVSRALTKSHQEQLAEHALSFAKQANSYLQAPTYTTTGKVILMASRYRKAAHNILRQTPDLFLV